MVESSTRVGAATVTRINVGLLRADMVDWMRLSEPPRGHDEVFNQPLHVPIQCVLIQHPDTTVLVDACLYDLPPDSPYAIPGYVPPPSLLDQLAALGVSPDEIAHVVITHGHFDHFTGVTQPRGDDHVPSFPRARYYMGHPDVEEWQSEIADTTSFANHTLGVLMREGLLERVSGDLALPDAVQIMSAPGETPGHQIVRVHSQGETLYCLGDLYHHAVEIEHQDWMVNWADPGAMLGSRNRLVESALAENALLIATHIPTVGRLTRNESGVIWNAV